MIFAIPILFSSLGSGDLLFTHNIVYASTTSTPQQVKIQLSDGSTYQGEVKEGLPNGKGTQIYPDGRKYIGEFANGMRDGSGIFTWSNGERHAGVYKNGEASGYGIHTWKSGESCTGIFTNGSINGPGIYTWPDGRKYEGNFKNGVFHGLGTFTHKDGKIQYPIYKDNLYQGEYQIIPPSQIEIGKADWIDKQVLFIDKSSYTSSIYSVPGDSLSIIKSEDLYNKRYIIKSLIVKKSPYLPDTYFWQLQSESSNEVIWYSDEQYTATMSKSYVSPYGKRPFLFQSEIDSPPGYHEVSPSEIQSYKANWIGQKIKFKTSNPSGFKSIVQDSSSVSADKLVNRPLKVLALYKESLNNYKPKYYWKFIDDESGESYWFFDDHYSNSALYGHSGSLEDTRPFYIESEIQIYDQKIKDFKSWVGKSIWADLNKSYEFGRLKFGHLEKLVITGMQVDDQVKEVIFSFQRENGSIVTWRHSVAKYLKDDDTPAGMLARVALLENPFEKNDWSDETWNLIKKQHVQLGWGKEKCIMSWGRPQDINKSIGAWGVHEQWVYGSSSYLYFEDGVLSSIQN